MPAYLRSRSKVRLPVRVLQFIITVEVCKYCSSWMLQNRNFRKIFCRPWKFFRPRL